MNLYSPYSWTFDIFPSDHKYLTFLKKVFRHEFRKNWFKRITVPIFETKSLVEKLWRTNLLFDSDFYLMEDFSAWIMRAYLDKNAVEEIQPVYYYFMQELYKKSSSGLKMLELIGGEIIWENDPILDAIIIFVTFTSLNKIWLAWKFEIRINTNWLQKEKEKYKEELISFYEWKKHILTPESREKLNNNPFLILKSKDEDEIILNSSIPDFSKKFIKKDSKAHYEKFKEFLDILKIPYVEDKTLFSTRDYVTNSIWEFRDESWKIVSRWYRHNALAKMMWEPKDIEATGFYIDTMVLISMLKETWVKIKDKDKIDLFIVQLWDDAKKVVLPLALKAREAWINTVVSFWTPSMKEQMLKAQRSNAKYIVIVWLMEAKNWVFQVRNTEDGTQEEVKKEDLIAYAIDKIWKENLDFYSPEKDFIIE